MVSPDQFVTCCMICCMMIARSFSWLAAAYAGPSLVRRYYPLSASNTVAYFTVLPSGCSTASLAAAAAANSPFATVNATLAAESAQSAAMKARLQAVQPLLQTLLAEPPASLTVTGINTADPVLWVGTTLQMCYVLPPSQSVDPKALVLYDGVGWWGSWYDNVLGAGTAPLPAAAQACVAFSMPATLPPGTYTIGLQDSTSGNVLTTTTFSAGSGTVYYSDIALGATAVTLSVTWSVDAAHVSAQDLVQVLNPAGAVFFWFYTSCQCQTKPGSGAVTAPTGTVSFNIVLAGAVKGAYTPVLFPGGGSMPALTGTDWIPWASIGL